MNKLLILLLLFSLSSLLANEVKAHKKLPLARSLPLLKTIESAAMHLGSGPTEVYVFVDPNCPHSRNFISLISESKKMQKNYHYLIFLYSLKRMHSEALVQTIYQSNNPLKMTIDVMLNKKAPTLVQTTKSDVKIAKIAHVAQEIDVYKRPYLVLIKHPRKEEKN